MSLAWQQSASIRPLSGIGFVDFGSQTINSKSRNKNHENNNNKKMQKKINRITGSEKTGLPKSRGYAEAIYAKLTWARGGSKWGSEKVKTASQWVKAEDRISFGAYDLEFLT